jgi:hypothetical protein
MHILQAGVFAFVLTVLFSICGVTGTRALIAVYFFSTIIWLVAVLIHKISVRSR